MIGLSVSFCIRDIIEDRMDPKTVEKIVGGISAPTPAVIDGIIRIYREVYWDEDPDACEKLFRQMLSDGKIEQPLLTKGIAPMLAGVGHWVESESDIEWSEQRCSPLTADEQESARKKFQQVGIKMFDPVDNRQ